MRRNALVLPKDIERACKGVRAAGYEVRKVVVRDGAIELIIDEPERQVGGDCDEKVQAARDEVRRLISGEK